MRENKLNQKQNERKDQEKIKNILLQYRYAIYFIYNLKRERNRRLREKMETRFYTLKKILIIQSNNHQKLMRNYYKLSDYSKNFKCIISFSSQITLTGRDYNCLFCQMMKLMLEEFKWHSKNHRVSEK